MGRGPWASKVQSRVTHNIRLYKFHKMFLPPRRIETTDLQFTRLVLPLSYKGFYTNMILSGLLQRYDIEHKGFISRGCPLIEFMIYLRKHYKFHKMFFCPHAGLNYGPSVYKTNALPLSYKGFYNTMILSTLNIKASYQWGCPLKNS